MSVWQTLASCTLDPAPISISSLSPRSTAPNQTLAPSPRRTLPISAASGAAQDPGAISGSIPSSL